ncbi:MAG TPA: N-acetyl-gamma-glutamyl-phosphate reductase [Candidatus Koribacter sp.]
MKTAIQPAVIGATGYSGFELTKRLLHHPHAQKPLLFRHKPEPGQSADLADFYPQLSGNGFGQLLMEPFSWDALKAAGVDLLFFCTPHEVSREWAIEAIDRGYKVVDLSGAWRLKHAANRAVYQFTDADVAKAAALDEKAVYGSPELHRDEILTAALVANPGCYATSIILALAPWIQDGLIDLEFGVICDSKSGVSGAGKQPTPTTHFVEAADNFSAYNVFGHRHTGEMLEQLGLQNGQLQFTPHLLPIPRGILSTIYVRPKSGATADALESSMKEFYAGKPWVRFYGQARLPQIKYSLHTNYCDIGFQLSPDGSRAVIVSCLDNLVKGAGGQAIQNMNVMYGFDEREGLQ